MSEVAKKLKQLKEICVKRNLAWYPAIKWIRRSLLRLKEK